MLNIGTAVQALVATAATTPQILPYLVVDESCGDQDPGQDCPPTQPNCGKRPNQYESGDGFQQDGLDPFERWHGPGETKFEQPPLNAPCFHHLASVTRLVGASTVIGLAIPSAPTLHLRNSLLPATQKLVERASSVHARKSARRER